MEKKSTRKDHMKKCIQIDFFSVVLCHTRMRSAFNARFNVSFLQCREIGAKKKPYRLPFLCSLHNKPCDYYIFAMHNTESIDQICSLGIPWHRHWFWIYRMPICFSHFAHKQCKYCDFFHIHLIHVNRIKIAHCRRTEKNWEHIGSERVYHFR